MDKGLALVIIGVVIAGTLIINAGIMYAILIELHYGNTLTTLKAEKQPGKRRSGVILRLPHINYGDNESLIDEA